MRKRHQHAELVADLLGEEDELLDEKPVNLRGCSRDEIKEQLIEHTLRGKTIRRFTKLRGAPKIRTIYNWLEQDPKFAADMQRAKAIGCDMIAQDCLDIADSGSDLNVKHRTLRINTRLKLLARWDERYGEKIDATFHLSDEEAMKEILSLVATAKTRQMRDPDGPYGRSLLN